MKKLFLPLATMALAVPFLSGVSGEHPGVRDCLRTQVVEPSEVDRAKEDFEGGEPMKRKMSRSTFLLGVSGAAALATFRLPASQAAQSGPEMFSG